MTPLQANREGFLNLREFNNQRTPEVFENKRNSAMTELIRSATIEKEQEMANNIIDETALGNFYIPEEKISSKLQENYFGEENKARNSQGNFFDFKNKIWNQGTHPEKEASNQLQNLKTLGVQKNLFPNFYSPKNAEMFQSPMHLLKQAKDESGDIMLECRDFFDRSYSKILQSQKKNMEAENRRRNWRESELNSEYKIKNFLNSNNKSEVTQQFLKNTKDGTSPFKLQRKRFSFSGESPKNSALLNISSHIGPKFPELNLTLSPTCPEKNSISFLTKTKDHINSNNLAEIILNAKNGIEKSIMNSPVFSRNFNNERNNLKNEKISNLFISNLNSNYNIINQEIFKGNSFEDLNSYLKKKENNLNFEQSNNYMMDEMKEVMKSNSKLFLSNYKSSLGSLSNKKFAKFSNSEKNKKKDFIEKKSSSGSKKSESEFKNKRNNSLTIQRDLNLDQKNKKLLFGEKSGKINLELSSSLLPLNTRKNSLMLISNKKKETNIKTSEELTSPFPHSLSPFLGFKQLPSTAQNTLSQVSKINSKNLDQVKIGHFTPISSNFLRQKKTFKKSSEQCFENQVKQFKNQHFGGFDEDYIQLNNGIKTPDSVSRKLGKRGGSDAKKCQTPGSFLGSSGKNKKKIRNM